MTNRRSTLSALAAVAIASSLALSACSNDPEPEGLQVVTAFYPLQYATQQVGGDLVSVTSLTKPGAEPHDLELSPRDVGEVGSASLVVYEKHFQPAVDDAVEGQAGDAAFDVSGSANLNLAAAEGDEHDHEGASDAEHADEEAGASVDPHFWLDPIRYAAVAQAIGQRLGEVDPDHAEDYTARASEFAAKLRALDEEFTAGLQGCRISDLVTGHAAFVYLADRYGFHQEGITGVNPDVEPSAIQMRDIAAHVEESGVTTIYAETLLSPDFADTIARETGAKVEVLDPIEGITDSSAGTDYFEVMRSNLTTLRAGQGCS